MKKLVDVAKDLHITPQAIYKRKGTDAELSDRIIKGTVKRGKHTFLDDDAVSAIMSAFAVEQSEPEDTTEPPTKTTSMLDALVAQLAEKDRQIAQLQLLLSQQQQLTMKSQLLLEAPKKRWWEVFKKE